MAETSRSTICSIIAPSGDPPRLRAKTSGPPPPSSKDGSKLNKLKRIETNDFLIETKTLSTHKAPKVSAQRFGVLARLIFRPAVQGCLAPTIGIPLLAIWSQLC